MSEETDRIIGLEIGANDCLVKLFNPREFWRGTGQSCAALTGPSAWQACNLALASRVPDTDTRAMRQQDGHEADPTSAAFKRLTVLLERPHFAV